MKHKNSKNDAFLSGKLVIENKKNEKQKNTLKYFELIEFNHYLCRPKIRIWLEYVN